MGKSANSQPLHIEDCKGQIQGSSVLFRAARGLGSGVGPDGPPRALGVAILATPLAFLTQARGIRDPEQIGEKHRDASTLDRGFLAFKYLQVTLTAHLGFRAWVSIPQPSAICLHQMPPIFNSHSGSVAQITRRALLGQDGLVARARG